MKRDDVRIIYGFREQFTDFRILAAIFRIAWNEYHSVRKIMYVLRSLFGLRKDISGLSRISRMVRGGEKSYWNFHLPGFPSKAWQNYILGEMNRVLPVRSKGNRLDILFISVTCKCPLNCRHCYEWDALNGKEILSLADLKNIAARFQQSGVGHIQLIGGEPLARFDDAVELIRSARQLSEVWMATCGYGLDPGKARTLREAGLTGVVISLDHVDPEKHNFFRGNPGSYEWVMSATRNCRKAGLLTCWSLCVTREFLSRENLFCYARLAKEHGVSFVQLLEPFAVGHFKGQRVGLDPGQIRVLEDFYREVGTSKKYHHFPVVEYIAQYQRKIGCLGSGKFYAYVDTAGNIQSCPFCRTEKVMNCLSQPVDDLLEWVRKEGCQFYPAFDHQHNIHHA